MKQRVLTGIAACGIIASLGLAAVGCGKTVERANTFGNTDNGIYVYADSSVEVVRFYEWDQDKYDADELKGFMQEEIDDYNDSHEFTAREPETNEEGEVVYESKVTVPIEIEKCESDGDSLCVDLLYATAQDYFNYIAQEDDVDTADYQLLSGDLVDADAAIQNATFLDEEGEAVDVAKLLSSKKAADYRYVSCNFPCMLYGEGTVIGCAGGSYDPDANCVEVKEGETVILLFE